MQIRSVLFIVGVLLVCVGASLVLPLGVSLWYGDGAFLGLLSSLVIMVGGGLALAYTNRSQTPLNLTLRDGFAVVGICWIVASFAGGLPFVLTSTASVTDAVFEAASGFTTTGATIFADIEGLPHGLLMWRSLTHWIGGLGIILLSLIVLPLLGVGGMQLYRAEVTGPSPDKLTPRMQDTALTLWRVYCLMTIVLTVLLYIAGMDWFDALNHSFSTVATGGFSTKNNSIAAYPQASIQWILIFFMFIAGINFSLHAQALRGVVKVYLRDRECRFYTVLLILGSAGIVAGARGARPVWDAFVPGIRGGHAGGGVPACLRLYDHGVCFGKFQPLALHYLGHHFDVHADGRLRGVHGRRRQGHAPRDAVPAGVSGNLPPAAPPFRAPSQDRREVRAR